MLHHVIDRCLDANSVDEVVVVTDSDEVYQSVNSTKAKALMTHPECSSGTARIASVIKEITGRIILNVQADQPVVEPNLIDGIVQELIDTEADISTPIWQIKSLTSLNDPSVVKVVCGHKGEALYFTRSPVPYIRDKQKTDWVDSTEFWGHHGIYGFRRHVLENFDSITPGKLEDLEKLEQLRFLEAGFVIQTLKTSYKHISVDEEADIKTLKSLLNSKQD
jgi:3-deoxy-manno-octulosonate cytidylyltransferase (CMP-KDO synthetase)